MTVRTCGISALLSILLCGTAAADLKICNDTGGDRLFPELVTRRGGSWHYQALSAIREGDCATIYEGPIDDELFYFRVEGRRVRYNFPDKPFCVPDADEMSHADDPDHCHSLGIVAGMEWFEEVNEHSRQDMTVEYTHMDAQARCWDILDRQECLAKKLK